MYFYMYMYNHIYIYIYVCVRVCIWRYLEMDAYAIISMMHVRVLDRKCALDHMHFFWSTHSFDSAFPTGMLLQFLCNPCDPGAPAEPMHQLQLDVFPCAARSLSIS